MYKPSLILLHGALGCSTQFDSLVRGLTPNFNSYTLNFEGHGNTANNNYPFSIEGFTQQLNDFITKKKLSDIRIFGFSMGGYVALNYASQNNTVKSILTLGTKFNWTPTTAAKETKLINPVSIEAKVPKFAQHLQQLHGKANWKTMLNNTKNLMLSLGETPPLNTQNLSNIKCKVTCGWGELDTMVTEEETQNTVSQIGGARFKSYPNTKHPFEQLSTDFLMEEILKELK